MNIEKQNFLCDLTKLRSQPAYLQLFCPSIILEITCYGVKEWWFRYFWKLIDWVIFISSLWRVQFFMHFYFLLLVVSSWYLWLLLLGNEYWDKMWMSGYPMWCSSQIWESDGIRSWEIIECIIASLNCQPCQH